jgi:hypothetical protein
MMAPAIIGTLFNNERRQTPFSIELDGFAMRGSPYVTPHLAGEKPFASPESSGPPFLALAGLAPDKTRVRVSPPPACPRARGSRWRWRRSGNSPRRSQRTKVRF